MKKSILMFLPMLMLGLLFTSCKKESMEDQGPVTNDDPTTNTEAFFSCTIDDVVYSTKGFYAYAVDFDDNYAMYGVESFEDDGMVMYVAVDKSLSVGTHTMDDNTWALMARGTAYTRGTHWGDGQGTVTIEEKTATHVKGTFSFIGVNPDNETEKVVVKDGKFNVAFR